MKAAVGDKNVKAGMGRVMLVVGSRLVSYC